MVPGVLWTAKTTCMTLGWLLCSCAPSEIWAQDRDQDLSAASLEQLTQMQISVSSFARKDEDLWLTPAAVFVITKEDIANSTASSIPELLRVVPGLQVAQINASYWAVTARGFNSEYASKLLVLIDGRTMYSEIYSGAHWDTIDLPLEAIERIEVIRGPGAAVWGTNAVNGVINIISKPTQRVTAVLASGHASRIDDGVTVGYDGPLGDRAQYRGFLRFTDRKPFELASGAQAFDGAGTWRGGGRLAWKRGSSDSINTSGDLYGGHLRNQIMPSVALPVGPDNMEHESVAGGFVLSRWEHKSESSDTALQGYYDDQSRHELSGATRTRTTDVDFQRHHVLGGRNDLVWGSELRFTADHIFGVLIPATRSDYRNYLGNGFLQDEIAIRPQHLTVTLGSKVQMGTLAGFQVQPSVRLLFAPSSTQSVWAAISRAAVAPSLQDKYVQFPLTLGVLNGLLVAGLLQGSPGFKAETVVAYEAGYRRRIGSTLTVDLASFFNDSHRIESINLGGFGFQPLPAPHLLVTFSYENGFRARSGGTEAAVSWKPLPTLTLHGSYAWMEARTTQVDPGNVTILNAWNTPRNSFTGTASWNFARKWSVDALVSRVGCLPTNPLPSLTSAGAGPARIVPAYTRADVHVRRKLGRSIELDAGGTNLQSPRHLEFDAGTGYITPAYIPRSLFGKGTWTF